VVWFLERAIASHAPHQLGVWGSAVSSPVESGVELRKIRIWVFEVLRNHVRTLIAGGLTWPVTVTIVVLITVVMVQVVYPVGRWWLIEVQLVTAE